MSDTLTAEEVRKMTVTQLHAALEQRGLDIKRAKKAELAAKLIAAVEEENAASEASVKQEGQAQVKEEHVEQSHVEDDEVVGPPAKRRKPEPTPQEEEATIKTEVTEPAQAADKVAAEAKEDGRTSDAVAVAQSDADVEAERRERLQNEDDDDEDDLDYEELDNVDRSRSCPYLDTINRSRLDFDFEKLCSISLSNQHVYCLPDNYEVIDSSLDDIKYVLRPTFTENMIKALDTSSTYSRGIDGTPYLPGVVGLNNIKANDYVNVFIQCLNRVPRLRNFFLRDSNTRRINDPLIQTVTELFKKLNNPRAFRGHVSPHEFLQAINRGSKRMFKITEQSDPIDLFSWFLNTVNRKLMKHKQTILEDCFRGKMRIASRKLPPNEEMQVITGVKVNPNAAEFQEKISEVPFFFLGVDLPPPPLFQDESRQNIIPQVPLFELLNKFDGVSEHELKTYKDIFMRKFELLELPKYLVLHFKRFTKNNFFIEKNPTIVNFPVKNIDLTGCVDGGFQRTGQNYKYDLICNIVHDGLEKEGTYRAHVHHKGTKKWYEVQDLHVAEILPEMITLSESYIQIWERQEPDAAATSSRDGTKMETSADV